jgi:CRP-like cAMP-binding protein
MASLPRLDEPEGEDPIAPLLLKLRHRDGISTHEADMLRGAVDRVEELPAGQVLVAPGQPITFATLLIEGFLARYKLLPGQGQGRGQRQITELHVPGDFSDLHGYLLKRLDHHIGALTPVRVAYLPHDRLTRLTEREPHLARLLWLSTLMDAEVQRERILSIGRRSALARVAHLFCELCVRLDVVDAAAGGRFALPVTQMDIADATGLTSVHVNRMLRRLRSDGLVTFRAGVVEVHDLPGLEQAADFDRAYLYLGREPR